MDMKQRDKQARHETNMRCRHGASYRGTYRAGRPLAGQPIPECKRRRWLGAQSRRRVATATGEGGGSVAQVSEASELPSSPRGPGQGTPGAPVEGY